MAKRPPSIAAQHADWLRLVEVSGPFVSLPVLVQTFSHGLDKIESDSMRRVRTGYADWKDDPKSPTADSVWIDTILNDLLEHEPAYIARFDDASKVPSDLRHRVDEHAETLCPQLVIKESDKSLPEGARVLVCTYPRSQRLDRSVAGSRWSASPQSRMAELCRATGVRLGLVTNGEQWTLVDAPKEEVIGYATWYAQLWLDEPTTLAAFRSLLGRHRLFAVGQDETLEALLSKSRENQHEVTTQLGLQVRRAVEVLVRAIDRADQDSNRALLKDVPVTEIYQAAVTVMMRLVFLLSAEERGLLLLGDPLFDQHYAVSTLCEQLREVADKHGEEVLERRRDAWCRLLAAFRAVHGGVQHDRLQIRAYGGGLFDPDRFPFLEGRPKGTAWRSTLADPLPIDNRTVLHALESLQFLQIRIGGHTESRRLSFRALGIEQIGHVYEGLLDHTAVRAKDITLGLLGPDGAEAEVPLAALEEKRRRGEADLIDFLHEHKVKSGKPAIKKLLATEVPAVRLGRMERLCRDAATWKRVEPFAAFIRDDDFGQPLILLPGQLYATAGQDRSDTGTQYTPVSLTQPVVEHSLEPLVYIGPAEGKPRDDWQLRSAKEILDLKVCDMACGSGAFLVQACRYLADRLLDAWAIAEKAAPAPNPGKLTFPTIAFDGTAAKGERDLVPSDPDERLLVARRLIAQRCLYGVDINPVAAEMAKLSIWLLTLSKDKPFSFLDHAIRSGDSQLGLHDIEQLRRFTLDRSGKEEVTFNQLRMTDLIETTAGTRLQIEQINSENIGHVQVQARLLGEAERQTERLKFAADMLISGYLQPARNAGERKDAISSAAVKAGQLVLSGTSDDLREYSARALGGKKPFHWCLEFPEIINANEVGGGFDAIIGNPPFKGGQKLTGIFGDEYREYLVKHLGRGQRGSADLVAYFFLRMASLLKTGGHFGLIATNTIAQGDTREVGLDQLVSDSHPDRVVLTRAMPSRPWPGGASLEVAHVYGRSIRGQAPDEAWRGPFNIDDAPAVGVTSFLTPPGRVVGKPYRLKANEGKSFQGSIVLGMGFVMAPEEARGLIARSPRNAEVLMPYLNGEDLNSRPDQSPSRWVINFRDWPLKREALTLPGGAKASWMLADEKQRKAWLRTGIVPQDYTDPVAADFPDCLAILEAKAKAEREKLAASGDNSALDYARRWWQFGRPTVDLYAAVAAHGRTILSTRVSKFVFHSIVPGGYAYDVGTNVLLPFLGMLGVLNSTPYDLWVRCYASSLETRVRYTVTDCFETFPLPDERLMCSIDVVGMEFFQHVAVSIATTPAGITAFLNGLHDASIRDTKVTRARDLLSTLDPAVVAAYGWDDLIEKLRHGFYPTKQGERFTIHPDARAEILARLLALNHQRYAEEVAAGLHDTGKAKPKPGKAKKAKDKADASAGLFKESE
ncbi:MAG TPA: hypothetical protein VF777_05135 [Phycisphaerales bacterium]